MITHSRLANAIMVLRPGSRSMVDFVVRDDGDGPFLVEGSMVDPPTQEEVDAVTDEQLDFAQATKNGIPPISPIQFVRMLKLMDIITQSEALAFAKTREIPPTFQALIDAVPDQDLRETIELQISGATEFRRDHPATALLQQDPFGLTSQQIDLLWYNASKL